MLSIGVIGVRCPLRTSFLYIDEGSASTVFRRQEMSDIAPASGALGIGPNRVQRLEGRYGIDIHVKTQ